MNDILNHHVNETEPQTPENLDIPRNGPFLRSAYNYDRDQASEDSGLKCEDPTLTQQQFQEETDINTIVERFGITGQMPTNVRMPAYGDFTGIFDFQTAMNAITQARETFAEMPAKVRARFHNDPQEFLQFCEDENNRAEAEKLGLVSDEALAKAAALATAAQNLQKAPPQNGAGGTGAPQKPPAS